MLISAIRRLRGILGDLVRWRRSRRELRGFLAAATVEDIVQATWLYQGDGYYRGIPAVQSQDEITRTALLVQSERPKTIVEIGTKKGGGPVHLVPLEPGR